MAQHDDFRSTIIREYLQRRTTFLTQPTLVFFVVENFKSEAFLRKEK